MCDIPFFSIFNIFSLSLVFIKLMIMYKVFYKIYPVLISLRFLYLCFVVFTDFGKFSAIILQIHPLPFFILTPPFWEVI